MKTTPKEWKKVQRKKSTRRGVPRKKTTRRPAPKKKKATAKKTPRGNIWTARKKAPRKKIVQKKATSRAATLRKKLAGGTKRAGPIPVWFERNEAAREFVELWMDMKAEGEVGTDFETVKQVFDELVSIYGYPSKCLHYFYHWLELEYGDRYRRAMGR